MEVYVELTKAEKNIFNEGSQYSKAFKLIPLLLTVNRVTPYVVPFVTHTRTKETKPVVVGQVQGYVISSIIFCDRK